MVTTGTLTFHAAHNYGSMLQAYALQRFLLGLGFANEIVDLRLPSQREMYEPFRVLPAKSAANFLQHLLDLRFKPALDRKYRRFEQFLSDDLQKTAEFGSGEELERAVPPFDYFIAGSDQIWNLTAGDFDWSYFLPFAQGNALAYAPSLGPGGQRVRKEANWDRVRDCLSHFKAVSVREQGSAALLEKMTGIRAEVLVAPTMLLTRGEWDACLASRPSVRPGYILVYSPAVYTREMLRTVRETARRTGKRVVITNPVDGRLRFATLGFEKAYDCGPWEFLQLVRSADLVMTTSFHAVVFSLLFERPFFAYRDYGDNRIDHFLSLTGMEDRLIRTDARELVADPFAVDFGAVPAILERERARSRDYLLQNLR